MGLMLLAGPYLGRETRHIASAADDSGIPYVEVRRGDEGMSEDGLHPNDKGYWVIADRLGNLSYEPLIPPLNQSLGKIGAVDPFSTRESPDS
jgi:hypothetical protein